MALTAAEEALVRELIAQNPELLSLAGNEATIISKLGASKKNLSQLAAALSLNDTDLLFTRQGTSDKSVVLSVLKAFVISGIPAAPAASDTVQGIVELATQAETQTGTDAVRAVTPAGLTSRIATETRTGLVELATNAETQTGTDAARAVTPAGLSSRLATETLTGLVELATSAEAQAFTANKFIDGAKLADAFKGSNLSLTPSGYQKLPSGLIIQWGTTAITVNGSKSVTMPIAFPTAGVALMATGMSTTTGEHSSNIVYGMFTSTSAFTICQVQINMYLFSSAYWTAIGY